MLAAAASPVFSADLEWERDGIDWPLREHSRFVAAGGLQWHVQQLGQGPQLLLIHGTGAATHSWRHLAPLLAPRFTVTACDLPGHGFTRGNPPGGLSLAGMGQALSQLLQVLRINPALVVGHSAGAAILARMCLDQCIAPAALVSLNGALLPLSGFSAAFFSPLAKLLALSSLPSRLVAWGARDPKAVERLLASTGSSVDPQGIEFYGRLVRCRSHVDGALRMMAQWDLQALAGELPRLRVPLVQIIGSGDRTVPPGEAARVCTLLPRATTVTLPRLGHLAHEERADEVAAALAAVATRFEVLREVAA